MAMIPHIPVGFANCRYLFTCVGVDHITGFSMGMNWTGLTDTELADAADTLFTEDVLDGGSGMGTAWTYIGLELTIGALTGADRKFERAASVTGTLSTSTIPPNCAGLVRKRTDFAGRNMRGRVFFPPCMLFDADIDAAGSMSGALATSHTILWEAYRVDMAAADAELHLIHQYDPEVTSDPVAPTPIVQLTMQSKLATQRRRLR